MRAGDRAVHGMKRRPRVVFLVGLVWLLVLAACGADDASEVVAAADGAEVDGAEAGSAVTDLQGLTDCDSVPVVRSAVDGPLSETSNPPEDVMQALSAYGQQNAEVFGGLWIDRVAGAVVIAVTDDPETHRAAVATAAGLDGRDDVAVDVVAVAYTEAELRAVLEGLFQGGDRIESLVSGGQSTDRNVVSLDLVDPTADDLTRLADAVDTDLVCVTVTVTPPRPTGAVEVLSLDPAELRLTCGGSNSFPRSALDEPVPIESSDHPAALAALELFDGDGGDMGMELDSMFGDNPQLFVLDIGEDQAQFATIEPNGFPGANVRVDRVENDVWRATGFGGGCNNLSVAYPEGLNQVEIDLDPASLPTPDQTEIALLVTERACASGQPMGDRLLEPQIIEESDRVLLVFAAAVKPGGADCPGNPSTPVTVALSAPLGDRELLDGGVFPPASIEPAAGDS